MPALKPRSGAMRARKSTRKPPRKASFKPKAPSKAATGPKKVRAKPQQRAPAKTKSVALRKVGGSLMAAIPAGVVKRMGLSAGHVLAVDSDGKRLILEPKAPATPKRYTLRQILASCNFDLAKTDEELEWEAAPRVGREAL